MDMELYRTLRILHFYGQSVVSSQTLQIPVQGPGVLQPPADACGRDVSD